MALSPIFQKLNHSSTEDHMPGSKVINAFYAGLTLLDSDYDFLAKLDADCILPDNYFEILGYAFKGNPKVGIAGGYAYERNAAGMWKLNHPMNKDHVRGAFKAYSKRCFEKIGGLRKAITGKAYNKKARLLQGKAMYTMRYGFWISLIASLKMTLKQTSTTVFFDNMEGFLSARRNKESYLVNAEEGKFIRKFRWGAIRRKLF